MRKGELSCSGFKFLWVDFFECYIGDGGDICISCYIK